MGKIKSNFIHRFLWKYCESLKRFLRNCKINGTSKKQIYSKGTHGPIKDLDSHIIKEQILNSRILFMQFIYY